MISLCIPTRHRLSNIIRLIESIQVTASNIDDIELVIYIDDDDTSYDNYEFGMVVREVRGPRIVLADMWNKCAEQAQGDVLMIAADDIIFLDNEWDRKVYEKIAQYPDRIGNFWGKDGSPFQDSRATHSFLTREWVNAVGYLVPPYFSCDYVDTWINDVSFGIDRYCFIEGAAIYHFHSDWGASEKDDVFIEKSERNIRDNNKAIYNSSDMIAKRAADITKLKRVMI